MTTFPGSPRVLKAGLVLVDPKTAAVKGAIALQYNPDTLSRSFVVRGMSGDGERSEAQRLTGPPVETFKLEAEIDATDQLEFPDRNPNAVALGIQPQLAALEMLIYPSAAALRTENSLLAAGTIEIAPAETPLLLFVWGKDRVVPVRLTDLSITEEAFDPLLNPIRAKVSLSLRVLSVNDLPADHRGSSLYLAYQQQKEKLAKLAPAAALDTFGITGI